MSDETKTIPGVANPEASHTDDEPAPQSGTPESPAAPAPAAPGPQPSAPAAPSPAAPGTQPSPAAPGTQPSRVAPFPHPATPPTPAAAAAPQPAHATPPAAPAAAPGSSGSQSPFGTTAAVPGWQTGGAYSAAGPTSPPFAVPPGAPAPGAPASAQPAPPGAPGHPQPPTEPPTAATAQPVPPPPPGRGRRAVAVLTAAGLMLVSATGGALLALNLDDNNSAPRTVSTSLSAPASGSSAGAPDEPLSQAAAAVLPSVVSISFDAGQVSGSGSGIVISSDGQILTNNHVVESVANGGSLKVTFSDGSTADASIVGRDPATDLAVIQAKNVSGLKPAKFGDSDTLHVGDTVLAIGSPLGLDGSVSAGIVSALGRSVTLGAEQSPFGGSSSGSQTVVIDAIQTDAAINPGNSGGALVNANGEVVGINTAIASLAQGTNGQGGNIGVGFAIPIDSARDIAQQLIDNGSVTHAFLGVRLNDTENGGGALVQGVESGQPADQAGLKAGDLITKVGDHDVTNAADLTAAIRTLKPGDKVTVSYTRDGAQKSVEVTLGELPEN